MDLEELSQRLSVLENAQEESKQQAALNAFMDKYGSNISNNNDLGLVILNELNRRGVDTSAADEAVQSILDQLRMEATSLLDTIKSNMNAAGELIDKIDAMDQSVKAAAPATGTMPEGAPAPEEGAPAPEEGAPGDLPMPPELPPEGAPAPELPPEGAPAPEEVPPEGAPAQLPPEGAPAQLPPNTALSDERMKNIRSILSKRNKAKAHVKTEPKAPKQKMTSFSNSIIDAAKGGI